MRQRFFVRPPSSRWYWLAFLWMLAGSPLFAEEPAKDAAAGENATAEKPEQPKFVRVLWNDRQEAQSLQTSVVRYVQEKPASNPALSVDLVGAIHIADKSYYDELNKRFADYEAVLYELVAAEGVKLPRPGEQRADGGSAVSSVQQSLKSMLDLQFQLECVDYTKANFVHADMSPDEFAATMRERGESIYQMFFRMLGQNTAMQSRGGRSPNVPLFGLLFSRHRTVYLKRMMAEQFDDMEGQMALFDGPDGSTIITERNKKALDVLRRELAAGKKRLAIFYGAGHLPDMEKRLLDEFGLRRADETWLTAWTMKLDGK